MIEMGLRLPVAIGEDDIGLLRVLPQFQVGTAFKMPDALLAFIKEPQKVSNRLFPKGHLHDAYNHENWILMVVGTICFSV